MRAALIGFSALASALALSACASTSGTAPTPSSVDLGAAYETRLPFSADVSRIASEQPAGSYKLDTRHAHVIWRLRHMGLAVYAGRFDTISGTMTFDPADPAKSSVSATIDTKSVSTGLLNQKGERAFDEEISTQVFSAAQFPTITFVSKSIELTGPTTGKIVGDLTLRGVTKPVVLDATFDGGRFVAFRGKQVLGFSATTMISRKEFGAALTNPLANAAPSDDVEILISAEFIKE